MVSRTTHNFQMSYAQGTAAGIALAGNAYATYTGIRDLKRKFRRPDISVMTPSVDYNAARIKALSRQINRIKPATEQSTRVFSLTTAGAAAVEANVQITTDFGTDSDFQAKVLGDKVRLLRYDLRYNIPTVNISVARFIVYQPYNVGERITGIDFQSIIDSSKFRVIRDWTVWPSLTNSSVRQNVAMIPIKLGGRITRYDRTNATTMTCQSGEYVLYTLILSTAASTTGCQHRLTYQNK